MWEDLLGPQVRQRSVVILSGAGISAESGLATFRGPDGLWEGHRVEDVATPEAFERDPALVHRFYNARRAQLRQPEVRPNHAHEALARLQAGWEGPFLLVTQNIDDLHERAGSRSVVHMHGELGRMRCTACNTAGPTEFELSELSTCAVCGSIATLRPDIVWFGEMPRGLERIYAALETCDLFVAIGTSGQVYPAAGFVDAAGAAGAFTLEVNLARSQLSQRFDGLRQGPAGQEVPVLVDELLAS